MNFDGWVVTRRVHADKTCEEKKIACYEAQNTKEISEFKSKTLTRLLGIGKDYRRVKVTNVRISVEAAHNITSEWGAAGREAKFRSTSCHHEIYSKLLNLRIEKHH